MEHTASTVPTAKTLRADGAERSSLRNRTAANANNSAPSSAPVVFAAARRAANAIIWTARSTEAGWSTRTIATANLVARNARNRPAWSVVVNR